MKFVLMLSDALWFKSEEIGIQVKLMITLTYIVWKLLNKKHYDQLHPKLHNF